MPATEVNIAAGVLNLLQGGSYTETQDITFQRGYRPELNFEEIGNIDDDDGNIYVTVIASGIEVGEIVDRAGRSKFDFLIDVVIQARVNAGSLVGSDALVLLKEEIATRIRDNPAQGSSVRTQTINEPALVPEHYDEIKLFTTVLRTTYTCWR